MTARKRHTPKARSVRRCVHEGERPPCPPVPANLKSAATSQDTAAQTLM